MGGEEAAEGREEGHEEGAEVSVRKDWGAAAPLPGGEAPGPCGCGAPRRGVGLPDGRSVDLCPGCGARWDPAAPPAPAPWGASAMHPHGRPPSPAPSPASLLEGPCGAAAGVACVNGAGQWLAGLSLKRRVWDVPQGTVERGETPREAAARELLEETGVRALPGQLLFLCESRHATPAFASPFSCHVFWLAPGADASGARNMEPGKTEGLGWYAPCQLPGPRGLALRLALALAGHAG